MPGRKTVGCDHVEGISADERQKTLLHNLTEETTCPVRCCFFPPLQIISATVYIACTCPWHPCPPPQVSANTICGTGAAPASFRWCSDLKALWGPKGPISFLQNSTYVGFNFIKLTTSFRPKEKRDLICFSVLCCKGTKELSSYLNKKGNDWSIL